MFSFVPNWESDHENLENVVDSRSIQPSNINPQPSTSTYNQLPIDYQRNDFQSQQPMRHQFSSQPPSQPIFSSQPLTQQFNTDAMLNPNWEEQRYTEIYHNDNPFICTTLHGNQDPRMRKNTL